MNWVKTGGANIHFESAGSGPALLFLHGWCNDLEYWRPQLTEHGRRFTAAAYDARGHGLSSAPSGRDNYRLKDFRSDLHALIRSLGLSQVTLVGHSLGAATAVALAASSPALVRGLVLCSADFGLQPKTAAQDRAVRRGAREWAAFAKRHGLAEWARRQIDSGQVPTFITASEKNKAAHILRYAHQPLQGFEGIAHTLPWWDSRLRGMLGKVRVPCRIIVGDQDALFFEGAKLAANHLRCDTDIIAGGHHDLARSSPEAFNAAINRAIDFVSSGHGGLKTG